MINSRLNIKRGLILILIVILIGLTAYVSLNKINNNEVLLENADAIFGGDPEAGYPEAGYLIAYQASSKVSICGLSYISPDTAVTAAHCIREKASIYIGNSDFIFDKKYNTPTLDIQVKPDWN